ncbi:MAG: 3-hydroxyanthranilate 3,4-dioxygenase [Cyclobacteriaceae bacterium]|nr:3-hydroxyanthranilate 3,4-dioxygenase [Cyclobacteriaceae bacterium]
MSKLLPKFNFQKWIDEHRHLLKPPVGNKCVWDNGEYIVMVVGGPNERKDYHLNQTPEFFYQVEGDITLKVIDEGIPKDVNIQEGEIYLLPSNVPHSPQRGANTIGLVIEQKRAEGMEDGLVWFCENCNSELYREPFLLNNIETDMPVIFDKFYSNKELRTCKSCGAVMEPPTAAV